MLKENLKTVEERIQSACKKAGRKREEITLIAVSKTKPPHMLQEAYDLGVRIFGENKVQEIREKYEVLPKDIDWHMIGHLQTNKVKYIVDKVKLIHSVDSFKLGEVIEKEAAKQNRIIDILLEVNVAQESSKFGLKTEEVGCPWNHNPRPSGNNILSCSPWARSKSPCPPVRCISSDRLPPDAPGCEAPRCS